MKKLLCVLMFGMVFGGDVSQKIIDISLDGWLTTTNLNELIPEYNLEWAVLRIVECPDYSCKLNVNNISQSEHWFSGGTSQDNTYYHKNVNSSFYAKSGQDIIIELGNNDPLTMRLLVTAEFPEEDTGYIEEGFDYCLHTGANLVSSPCRDEVAITDALPSEVTDNLTGIITEGGASTNLNGTWVGSVNGLGGGKGYWFISDMQGCFNYTCSEN